MARTEYGQDVRRVLTTSGRTLYGSAAARYVEGQARRRATRDSQGRETASARQNRLAVSRAQSAFNREAATGVRRTGGRVTERIGTRDLFTGRISNARNIAGYTRNEQLTMALARNLGDSWKEARRAIGRSTG